MEAQVLGNISSTFEGKKIWRGFSLWFPTSRDENWKIFPCGMCAQQIKKLIFAIPLFFISCARQGTQGIRL